MNTLKMLRHMVQMAAVAVFAYQMILAFEKYRAVSTTTVEETKDIKDAKLPSIFVCPKQYVDIDSEFREHGYYYGLDDFLSGYLKFKDNVLSWQGTENLPYANITRQMYPGIKTKDLVTSGNPYYNWKKAEDLKVHVTALNGICKQIDLNITNLAASDIFCVVIQVKPNGEITQPDIGIEITYPATSLHYMINPDSVEGDKPVTSRYDRQIYSLSLEEVHRLEESGECTNYGETAQFKTYADCVADEQKRIFKPIIGCTPPWTTDLDDEDACNRRITLDTDTYDLYTDKYFQLRNRIEFSSMVQHSSACLKPCLEVKVRSKFLKAKATVGKEVMLNFQRTVKVTRYSRVIPQVPYQGFLSHDNHQNDVFLRFSLHSTLQSIENRCHPFF